jgi:hypothetical protein
VPSIPLSRGLKCGLEIGAFLREVGREMADFMAIESALA